MDKEEEEMLLLPDEVIIIIFEIVFTYDMNQLKKLSLVNKEWNEKIKKMRWLEELKERIMKENGYMDMDCLVRYYAKRFLMCNDKIDIVYLKKHPSNIRVFVQSCIPWICYTRNEEFTYPYEGLDYESVRNRFYLFAKLIEMIYNRERCSNGLHSIFIFECNVKLMELLEILYLHIERNMKHFRNAFNIRLLITFLQHIYDMYMIRTDPYIISGNVDILYIIDWSVSISQCSDPLTKLRANKIYKEWPSALTGKLAEREAELLSCNDMVE